MKKLLASLSTFAVLTGALAVPTFAATEINTAKETNSQVLKIQPNLGVPSDGKVSLYSSPFTSYKVEGYGLSVEKIDGTWYLFSSKYATGGTLYEYYNGKFEKSFPIEVWGR
ncbi:hypothetical protein [Brevibacillus laterosporus]|uniref:Uncharacterized protein n=1 Tax=Brevibacillus laterosporus TaxID=1465 RepID=A0AAP8QA31_BRELA|nr:hypothetical protein [Brevibacillus laterosporus]MED1663246.1 hypothetical protein [Brevibacillus laterosporus]MED1669445.1 hypothetical protein [Brevibacillus laterosporus]MED1717725.1 hypothetical protein [Brevibacillus laterosporus]PPA84470.1 hypothetical protein C4A76_17650 [Brevibacillus laterosporus]PPA91517.1 hypothetical protein C4A77_22470 [Brevibacillus laterosporus]